MTKKLPFTAICCLLLGAGALISKGADLYVSPTGSSSGPGTTNQPYDLATALSGRVGRPGDTFWLRGGTYTLGYIETTIQGAPGAPITFRQMPGERARVNGEINFWGSQGYVTLWGFELFGNDPNRTSSSTSTSLTPADLNLKSGLFIFSPNINIINLVIHDHVRHGIYLAYQATNSLIYGCLVYNNGWKSSVTADGHNFYVQSNTGQKVLADNLAFNGTANNFQVYSDATSDTLFNVVMDGNVAFNAGVLNGNTRRFRDFLIGVDAPAIRADSITFVNNMGYCVPGSQALTQVQIGRQGVNGNLTVKDNYLPNGLLVNNWQNATFTGNTIAPRTTDNLVNLQQGLTALTANPWNNNVYIRPSTGTDFGFNGSGLSFAAWKTATGFDSQSSYQVGNMTGNKVFVRTNKYEPGRANIIAYHWDDVSPVTVDVKGVLPIGTKFEVRNAQDFFATPVLTGTYTGQLLTLPMTGLTVATPTGGLPAGPATAPRFATFVLIPLGAAPQPPKVQITRTGSDVVVTWPTNAGNCVLQSKNLASLTGTWTDLPGPYSIAGDQCKVTELASSVTKVYRVKVL